MLSFFRINDPYRLLILLLAILIVRLPYFISSSPLIYELDWIIIGDTLNQSDVTLYKDLLTPMAPLAALTYTFFDFLFGGAQIAYQLAAVLLVAYQFSLFNNIMYKNKAYNENSYIPAFIYALLMQVFFDFFTLSPVLISLTFILLVLDNIYLRIENKLDDATILKTGLFMGLAVLFYLPSIIFFIATLISFALLTSLIFRRYMLFVYGFLLPIAAVSIYFIWFDGFSEMLNNWLVFTITYTNESLISIWSFLMIIAVPAIFYLLALYRTFSTSRFTNYQVRVQQVMFIMFLAAWGSWLLSNDKAPYQLVLFVPFVAFFITHYVLLFKHKMKAEIFALVFATLVIGINYYIYLNGSVINGLNNYYKLNVEESIFKNEVVGKSLLVLGDSKSLYKDSKVGTPYYYWPLAKETWLNFENPRNIAAIYSSFKNEMPEVIIDENEVLAHVFSKMPTIASQYQRVSARYYRLKVNEN